MNLTKLSHLQDRRKKRIRFKLRLLNRKLRKRIYFHISNKHMYAQLIDEQTGKTLTGMSTLHFSEKKEGNTMVNKQNAEKLGELFYEKATPSLSNEKESLVFDRGNRLYHGRVKVFADTLRNKGMNF